MADGLFIALNGPAFRALAAKTTGPKQPPDVTGMITDSRQILDQSGHPRQSPEISLIAVGGRARQQPLGDFIHLGCGQFGFGTGWPFAGQGRRSALFPKVPPFVRNLSGHTQPAGDFGRRTIFLKEPDGLLAALFHPNMIACFRHARTINNPNAVVT